MFTCLNFTLSSARTAQKFLNVASLCCTSFPNQIYILKISVCIFLIHNRRCACYAGYKGQYCLCSHLIQHHFIVYILLSHPLTVDISQRLPEKYYYSILQIFLKAQLYNRYPPFGQSPFPG